MSKDTIKKHTDQQRPQVSIYTDGACSGNPGSGGWAALLCWDSKQQILQGSAAMTTNNRMELMAAIASLSYLKCPCRVVITTDSMYLKKGIEQWLAQWKTNNWKTSAKKLVKNRDLWESLDFLVEKHAIEWHWVRGHSGHAQNEEVDQLARQALEQQYKSNHKEI